MEGGGGGEKQGDNKRKPHMHAPHTHTRINMVARVCRECASRLPPPLPGSWKRQSRPGRHRARGRRGPRPSRCAAAQAGAGTAGCPRRGGGLRARAEKGDKLQRERVPVWVSPPPLIHSYALFLLPFFFSNLFGKVRGMQHEKRCVGDIYDGTPPWPTAEPVFGQVHVLEVEAARQRLERPLEMVLGTVELLEERHALWQPRRPRRREVPGHRRGRGEGGGGGGGGGVRRKPSGSIN